VSAASMTPSLYLIPKTDVPVTIGCVVRCVPDIADDIEVAAQDSMMPLTKKIKYLKRFLLVADNIVSLETTTSSTVRKVELMNFTRCTMHSESEREYGLYYCGQERRNRNKC